MKASYPDLGSVNDSKEGGLEELEEVKEGAGEGGCDSIFSGAPSPNIWARFQTTAVVLPLDGDPLLNINSGYTYYACCPGPVGPNSSVSPLVFCLAFSP